MAQPGDYDEVIRDVLTDPELGDYEGFGALCSLYRRLHPLERSHMGVGLAQAIGSLTDPPALADAVHLAYQLEIVDDSMERAIQRARSSDFYVDERVAREVDNYLALSPQIA